MYRRRLGQDGAWRLGRIDVLCDLETGRRREVARLADEVTVPAGEVIVREGEAGYEFMMLEQGQADVIRAGRRIGALEPGDCFGELAVLSDGNRRCASVVAASNVRAIVLTAHFTRELHDRLPSVGERIDRVAAGRRRSSESA
jgi:CRP-like cAMP-binding protein